MADIELVIKIPEEEYRIICKDPVTIIGNAIKNGTPLPKGHGDLKDVDKLRDAFIKWSVAVLENFTDTDVASIICSSPTIIKADKESEQE